MTGELYAGPGFARRSEHFHEDLQRLKEQSPLSGLNRLKVDKALHLGTADTLSPQERCLMAALLAHLDIGATENGATAVWPGAKRLCALLNIGDSTLRRLKGALEDKGFLVRRYDQRNRPLKDGAIDLKPFLLRVDALCSAVDRCNQELAAQRQERAEDRDRSTISARPLNNERPTRKPQEDISVPGLKVWEGFDADQLRTKAQAVLGPTNADRLIQWAEKRDRNVFGEGLPIALFDPTIRSRQQWFAWYATSPHSDVDFSSNLDRARRAVAGTAPVALGEVTNRDHPIFEAFAEEAGLAAATSYLGEARIEAGDKTLVIWAASRAAYRTLMGRLHESLLNAVRRAGHTDLQVCLRE